MKQDSEIIFYSRSINQLLCKFDCVIGKNSSHYFPMHIHNSFCIGLITKGKRKIDRIDSIDEIGENQLFIINQNEPHAIIQSEPHNYIAITIKGLDEKHRFKNIVDSAYCVELFEELAEAIISNNEDLIIKKWQLLSVYLKSHYTESNRQQQYEMIAIKAIEYIHTNYNEDITVEDIARHSCMSTFHFSRLFKKATGISPHSYLLQYRIKRSYHFLQTNDSIFDAAIKAGFYDSSHFIRTFFVYMGASPKHYQRSILNK